MLNNMQDRPLENPMLRNELEKPHSKYRVWIAALIILIVLGIMSIFLFKNSLLISNQQKINSPLTNILGSPNPTPTPNPFEDITIPYLRQREYKSTLGSLQKLSENQNYSSYLTSFDSDGLKINGLLTQPAGAQPTGGWPAIIFIHGYIPPKQYQTQGQYAEYVDFLARNEFVVFKIDLRGHGNSEGEPGGAYYSSDYVIDALNAYAALQASSFINPQKIGLWGHSMAGNIVMRSFAAKPEIPAVVIWAGAGYSYIDLGEYGISDSSYQPPQMTTDRVRKRQLLLATYGQPKEGNPFWQLVAPTSYLDDLKGATQLHHAINDEVVDIRYSQNLNTLLNNTQVEHQLHEYQSGGHNITGTSFIAAMQRTVEFFKQHLD